MPHLIATILAGNCEALIGDAIRSARQWVDAVLLVDTGITDGTRRIAEELAGERLIVEPFAWRNDFAAARNFALGAAARHGARWALTLDTDERLEFSGIASREELRARLEADPRVRAWLVSVRDGSYSKERFIRVEGITKPRPVVAGSPGTHSAEAGEAWQARCLPHGSGASGLHWSGRTHECLVGARQGERANLAGVTVWELSKTPKQFRAKLVRDLGVLLEETRDQPTEPRWWYYLGQTHEGLGQPREALAAFRRCAEIRTGWSEQAAWACYKAATCALQLGQHEEALQLCALGLARQAESPELAWLAGFACYRAGQLQQAIHWSRRAIELGHFAGRRTAERRIGFRHLPGWYEGPYDVLRHVYRRLGQPALAAECHAQFAAAKAHRRAAIRGDFDPAGDTAMQDDIGPAARLSQALDVATS
ncbi:MAG: glycosyltransferase [Pirellulaceae bacterium]